MIKLSHPIWQQKGGVNLELVITLMISVMANIISYFICKWLDRNDSDN